MLEHDRAPHHHLGAREHEVQHGDGQVGIDERVVEHEVAIVLLDIGEHLVVLALEEVGPGIAPARADEDLVALLPAVVEGGLRDGPDQERLRGLDDVEPLDLDVGDRAIVRPRPPLQRDVGRQVRDEQLGPAVGVDHSGSSPIASWRLNQ